MEKLNPNRSGGKEQRDMELERKKPGIPQEDLDCISEVLENEKI